MTKQAIEVRAGQVWEDCDKRMAKRRLHVIRVEGKYAVCRVSRTEKTTRVRLDRFKPTSTGYRLVSGGAS